jgi:predicted nucleic acid-binding Zn ribbon protein
MVTPIRDILKAAVRGWGLEPAARLARAQAAWARLVGPAMAEASAPVALRGGRLLVGVTHPTVGQEIRLRRPHLVAALARELGEDVITEVVPVARRRLPAAAGGRSTTRVR